MFRLRALCRANIVGMIILSTATSAWCQRTGGRESTVDPDQAEWTEVFPQHWALFALEEKITVAWGQNDYHELLHANVPLYPCYARFVEISANGRYDYGTGQNSDYEFWVGQTGSWANETSSWLDVQVRVLGVPSPLSADQQNYCNLKRTQYRRDIQPHDTNGMVRSGGGYPFGVLEQHYGVPNIQFKVPTAPPSPAPPGPNPFYRPGG